MAVLSGRWLQRGWGNRKAFGCWGSPFLKPALPRVEGGRVLDPRKGAVALDDQGRGGTLETKIEEDE